MSEQIVDLIEGVMPGPRGATSHLTVTASGRIIMPIAGMWRP